MRSRLIVSLLAAMGLLVFTASANAAVAVGISENDPAMFDDPLFKDLRAKHTRLVLSYDVVAAGGEEFDRARRYIGAADAAGIETLVSFQHSRGDAGICERRSNLRKKVCRLPSVRDYERNLRRFIAEFPSVKYISPWNEVNHFTQPTSRSATRAAQFSRSARKLCRGCKILDIDLLDQADNPRASRPKFTETVRYIRAFKRAYGRSLSLCGLHNYSAVNRFRDAGTREIFRALRCKQIQLTETGGLYDFGSFWTKRTMKGCSSAQSCQLKATKYLFTLVHRYKEIKRVYIYTWFGGVTPRFDSGLVANGTPRRAYAEVKRRV